MSQHAYLTIAKKYELTSPNHVLPYCWCMLFETKKNKSQLKNTVAEIKKNIYDKGFSLQSLEEYISIIGGWEKKNLSLMREILLDRNSESYKLINSSGYGKYIPKTLLEENSITDDTIKEALSKDFIKILDPHYINDNGISINDAEFDDVRYDDEYCNILEIIELLKGYYSENVELVFLYEILIFLELSNPTDQVELDLNQFDGSFKSILEEGKEIFVNNVIVYDYLFSHFLPSSDHIKIITDRLNKINNEDIFIEKIIIPIFTKMGYNNLMKVPYHGPNEKGIDIGPLYELDKFGEKIFYGIQAKSVKIHNNSRQIEGNINLISGQIETALQSEFDFEKYKIKLNKVFLITSKTIVSDAKTFAEKKFKDKIKFIDQYEIAKLVLQYNLKFHADLLN